MEREKYLAYMENGALTTPSYVLDCDVLMRHVHRIREIAGARVGLCYAMKANPFLARLMSDSLGRVEVCSPGELAVCRRMEVAPRDIIYSGVNKTEANIAEALEYNVGVVTVESRRQYELLQKCCEERKHTVDVYVRLSDGYQFGLNREELEHIVSHRQDERFLRICGLHYFSGTQKKGVDKNAAELTSLRDYLEELAEKYRFEPAQLEYGPGMYYPYYTNEDFDGRYRGLEELVQRIDEIDFPCEVTLEMGRFFAAPSGDYLTAVQDLKSVDDRNYCIVDGGIHQLNYYGQNMAMRTPLIDRIGGNGDGERKKWNICGSLCTFADVLARNVEFAELHLNDVLIFRNAGAYSLTEAPNLFLSREMPAIYMYREGELRRVRDTVASDLLVCR